MNRVVELTIPDISVSFDSTHINDNINWCINRGIPSLSFYHANPYFHHSNYIRDLGDTVTINTGRIL